MRLYGAMSQKVVNFIFAAMITRNLTNKSNILESCLIKKKSADVGTKENRNTVSILLSMC
jgi:hypothetical protein